MLGRFSLIRSPLIKQGSPQSMQRRMLQSTAPFASISQTINHHADFSQFGMNELIAYTRGFLTESGYRESDARSSLIASRLIDAFEAQDGAHKTRFISSLASLVQAEQSHKGGEQSIKPIDRSARSVVFEPDYSVDQLLLDDLPTIKDV